MHLFGNESIGQSNISGLGEEVIVPVVITIITLAIIAPLVGWLIQPYVEIKKNEIVDNSRHKKELESILRTVIGNLQVVLDQARNNQSRVLIQTEVHILTSRLAGVEEDLRKSIQLIVKISKRNKKLRQNQDKHIKNIAYVAGGSKKIKENIEKNTQSTINGLTGLRGVNQMSLQKYISNLRKIIKEL